MDGFQSQTLKNEAEFVNVDNYTYGTLYNKCSYSYCKSWIFENRDTCVHIYSIIQRIIFNRLNYADILWKIYNSQLGNTCTFSNEYVYAWLHTETYLGRNRLLLYWLETSMASILSWLQLSRRKKGLSHGWKKNIIQD